MTRRRLLFVALLLLTAIAFSPRPWTVALADQARAAAAAPEYGPPTGTLVIVGGGSTDGTTIMEKFIELGGGPEGRFVIVPTAGGNRAQDGTVRVYEEANIIQSWTRRGLKNVKMLHTHDPKVADTEAFAKVLRDATAVWFNGGRQWNIVDSYAGTLTYREFHKVLERGGVIGGSSAGATIQGEYLVRGDTSGPNVMMTEEPSHQKGFEFLRKSAIDQHINARNRWDDLIPVVQKKPNLLGIGLSEGTAIIVKGDTFEVMGKWKVAIHDNTRLYQPWEKPYFVLGHGDVYNMKTRRVEKHWDGTTGRRGGGGPEVTEGSGGSGAEGTEERSGGSGGSGGTKLGLAAARRRPAGMGNTCERETMSSSLSQVSRPQVLRISARPGEAGLASPISRAPSMNLDVLHGERVVRSFVCSARVKRE